MRHSSLNTTTKTRESHTNPKRERGIFGRQAAVADYYFSQAEVGITIAEIQVDDGERTTLGRGYATGAATPPLLDGGGTYLTVLGAFINPMNRGIHPVPIRVLATGAAWRAYLAYLGVPFTGDTFEVTYLVKVH
jgi:hypothetical protein